MSSGMNFYDAVRARYGRYSRRVLGFRHFPDGRDGLLPVQRRALWSLHDLRATSRGSMTKTSKATGHCFAAGTLVKLGNNAQVPIERFTVGALVDTCRGSRRVTRTFHNPPAPMVRVLLHDHRILMMTLGQKVRVTTQENTEWWVEAKDLQPGDRVVTRYNRIGKSVCGRKMRALTALRPPCPSTRGEPAIKGVLPTFTAIVADVSPMPDAENYCLEVEDFHEFVAEGVCVRNCFASGTPVSTPDGLRAIENMEVGDTVLTSRGVHGVTQTFHNSPADTVIITTQDGRVVVPTVGQEFKVCVDGRFFWKRADELQPGDDIVSL